MLRFTPSVPLCIYHGNCADGFGAAWVVRRALGGHVDFHAGVYQDPPPDVRGRDVIIVDFSYKRAVLEQMARDARSILILDHHKTAAEDLAEFPPPISRNSWADHLADVRGAVNDGVNPALPRVVFDMDRSGARLAWDFFNPGLPAPKLIRYIEDRDLWRFVLPSSRAFNANVFSWPYDFDAWDTLAAHAEDDGGLAMMLAAGDAIERKHFKDVMELVAKLRRRMKIGGVSIPVANLPYTLTSDAGHLMASTDDTQMAACYWDTAEGRVFSLRSLDSGPDVSAIAKQYGGGGHRNASGFRMPIGWEGDA